MRKILFNDKFGLTEAVLSGRKVMTRRIVTMTLHRKEDDGTMTEITPDEMKIEEGGIVIFRVGDKGYRVPKENQPLYSVGEELAVAQAYKTDEVLTFNAYYADGQPRPDGHQRHKEMLKSSGYRNKMFVAPSLMPHRIRITGIKAERLQDISDEDCMKEGVWLDEELTAVSKRNGNGEMWRYDDKDCYGHARTAFAALTDRISGKGTWEKNPWVYAYEFELVKED